FESCASTSPNRFLKCTHLTRWFVKSTPAILWKWKVRVELCVYLLRFLKISKKALFFCPCTGAGSSIKDTAARTTLPVTGLIQYQKNLISNSLLSRYGSIPSLVKRLS